MKQGQLSARLPIGADQTQNYVRIPFPIPAVLSLRSAGSLRRGTKARAQFLERFPGAVDGVASVSQVHSRKVIDVSDADDPAGFVIEGVSADAGPGQLAEADGLVAAKNGPVLAVSVADCMPILIYDQMTQAYALLHSGWRGTGILSVAVKEMARRFGTRSQDVVVTLGPCISRNAYSVDAARARDFQDEWGEAAAHCQEGQWFLDLPAANLHIAESLGLGTVVVIDHCTYGTDQLGSYRREGPEDYTTMLALLGPLWPHETTENNDDNR